ncbi:hypothetical protein ABVT39_008070 [Epinephelus coioides]
MRLNGFITDQCGAVHIKSRTVIVKINQDVACMRNGPRSHCYEKRELITDQLSYRWKEKVRSTHDKVNGNDVDVRDARERTFSHSSVSPCRRRLRPGARRVFITDTTSTTDKETEYMEKNASTLVQKVIEHAAVNLDKLMLTVCCCDAEERTASEDNNDTPAVAPLLPLFNESIMTVSSSCWSIPDSNISTQDISKEIKKEWQSFLYPEYLKEEVRGSLAGFLSDFASKAKKPARKSFIKQVKLPWKCHFGRKKNKKVKKVLEKHVEKSFKDSSASSKLDMRSAPLELVEEEKDSIQTEMSNLPSIASTSSFASTNKVNEGALHES